MSNEIRIWANGDECRSMAGTTVSSFLSELGMSSRQVVVELNLQILQKEDWDSILLKEGDRLEIIGFVGGGC